MRLRPPISASLLEKEIKDAEGSNDEFELVIEDESAPIWAVEGVQKALKYPDFPRKAVAEYIQKVKERSEKFEETIKPNIEMDGIPLAKANSPTYETLATTASTLPPDAAQENLKAMDMNVKPSAWEMLKSFQFDPLATFTEPIRMGVDTLGYITGLNKKLGKGFQGFDTMNEEAKNAVAKKDEQINEAKRVENPIADEKGEPNVIEGDTTQSGNEGESGNVPTGDQSGPEVSNDGNESDPATDPVPDSPPLTEPFL